MTPVVLVLCTVLPAALVLVTAMFVFRQQRDSIREAEHLRVSVEARRQSLPLRLQAYERITLLMERISPEALLLRVPQGELKSKEYEALLLESIRTEWNHNLSQQIYISEDLWNQVRKSRGNVAQLITLCSEKVHPDAPANELSKTILATLIELSEHPTQPALRMLRSEAFTLF